MNLALLAKLGWRLCLEKDTLWTQALAWKYCRGTASLNRLQAKQSSSIAWKGIVSAAGIIKAGSQARVYNGESTLFWKEKWLGDAPLIEECLCPLDPTTSFKVVKDYWDFRRGWKWEELEGTLSPYTLGLLGSRILRNDEGGNDEGQPLGIGL